MTMLTTRTTIDHRPGCTRPGTRTRVGRHGDLLERCRGCGVQRVVPPAERTARAPRRTQRTDATPSPLLTRYRCREHPERPVTWRGTGCPDCAAPTPTREDQP